MENYLISAYYAHPDEPRRGQAESPDPSKYPVERNGHYMGIFLDKLGISPISLSILFRNQQQVPEPGMKKIIKIPIIIAFFD